jgi:hypothetical protein
MACFVSDEEVEKALDFLRDSASLMGKLTQEAVTAEHMLKHIVALEMKKHEGSAAAQEREAKASEAYFRALTHDAVCAGELAKMKALREAASAKIEAWRTASSNFRSMRI